MKDTLLAVVAALLLVAFATDGNAWMRIEEGAVELDKTYLRLSSAGTATITAKTCDQCGEVSIKIDLNTRVVGADGKERRGALIAGYSGGATIMYNFETLRATQVQLWQ
ncbi:MAG: hypothetical protein AAGD86_06370 [Pseudomonadota bacterium]